jgi:hypothetical protein
VVVGEPITALFGVDNVAARRDLDTAAARQLLRNQV